MNYEPLTAEQVKARMDQLQKELAALPDLPNCSIKQKQLKRDIFKELDLLRPLHSIYNSFEYKYKLTTAVR